MWIPSEDEDEIGEKVNQSSAAQRKMETRSDEGKKIASIHSAQLEHRYWLVV
jgi:hypothetical protein